MAAPMKRGLISENETSKLSTQAAVENKADKFVSWCKEHQYHLSSKVSVQREGSCAQLGMVATEDIAAGENLFQIPRKLLLSPETTSIAPIIQQAKDKLGEEAGWVPLILALVFEYNNPESPWRPYLDLVPDFNQLDLPMFWTSEERQTLLTGTGVETAVENDLLMMQADFDTKALPFMKKHPKTFSPACLSFELYKRMVAFIMAYSFTEPPGKIVDEDKRESGSGCCPGKKKTQEECEDEEEDDDDDDEEKGGAAPPPMMVPMADILNHVAKNNAHLTFHKDFLRMVTTESVAKGEEVFNTYGDLANKHLLHMYGFAESYPANHFDTVDIPTSVVTEAAKVETAHLDLLADKLEFFQESEMHQEGEPYVIGSDGVLTDDEMFAVLKVLVMTPEEYKEFKSQKTSDDDIDDDDPSSCLTYDKIENLPASWKKILQRSAETCLSKLVSSEEKDKASMQAGDSEIPSRHRWALYVRYGQRKILNKLIDACR